MVNSRHHIVFDCAAEGAHNCINVSIKIESRTTTAATKQRDTQRVWHIRIGFKSAWNNLYIGLAENRDIVSKTFMHMGRILLCDIQSNIYKKSYERGVRSNFAGMECVFMRPPPHSHPRDCFSLRFSSSYFVIFSLFFFCFWCCCCLRICARPMLPPSRRMPITTQDEREAQKK